MRFFRRYRMELRVSEAALPAPVLPESFAWTAWRPDAADRHASAKFESFRGELDATVFPCLGELAGCRRLMADIAGQKTFLPAATWLITRRCLPDDPSSDCATIQGMAVSATLGAIQNVGVAAEVRGLGLGRALVLRSLHGFRSTGIKRVYLEVTASNDPAIELYRSLGFRTIRTMYKAAPVAIG